MLQNKKSGDIYSFYLKLGSIIICVYYSLILLFAFINNSVPFFQDRFSFNMVEGLSVYFGQRVLNGLPLYTDPFLPPYTLNLYPPLYPILSAALFRIFSVNIFVIRGLTIASEIVIGMLSGAIIFLITKNRYISIIFIPIIYGLLSINKFHGLARVDFVGLMFNLAAFLCYIYSINRPQSKTKFLYVFFIILSLLTKQTNVVVFATCFLYSINLWRKNKHKAAEHMMREQFSAVLIYLFIIIVLTLLTNGEFFKQNFLYQFLYGFNRGSILQNTFDLLKNYGFIFIWLLFCMGIYRDPLILLYMCFSFLLTFITFGKIGSDQNYSLELLLATSLNIATMFGNTLNKTKSAVFFIIFSLFFIGVVRFVHFKGFYYQNLINSPSKVERKTIDGLVEAADGLILSEDPLILINHNKEVFTYDPFMVWGVTNYNKKPLLANFLTDVKQGKAEWIFASVFVETTPSVMDILKKQYTLVYSSKHPITYTSWRVYRKNK